MNSEVLIERWCAGDELADEMIYQIIGKCSDRAMDGRNATAGPIAVIAVILGAILYIGLFILILPYLIR